MFKRKQGNRETIGRNVLEFIKTINTFGSTPKSSRGKLEGYVE